MLFELKKVIPLPLQNQFRPDSDIWNTQLEIQNQGQYFVSAASGKGKTTLQHILYGLRHDFEGEVFWKGNKVFDFSLEDWSIIRQNQLSVIFQDLRLFAQLSAKENLLLKNQLTNHLTEAEIIQMCQHLEVDHLLDKPCGILSYGQKQRFAIIRALCQPFELLLMDEPFAHLDQKNIQLACELIMQESKKQNAAYLIASLGDNYNLAYTHHLNL